MWQTVGVNHHAPESMAAALHQLATDPELRRAMGQASREHAAHFLLPQMIDALEARGCNGRPLHTELPQVFAERRGSTHFYFADSAEQLAPLMREYEDCEALLRPSNLEDVFLLLTDRDRLT